jgi:hypothetical protein
MPSKPKNSTRTADLIAIALLCVLSLFVIWAVPLDNTASLTMIVNAIVVSLTCLYYWQPGRTTTPRLEGKAALLAVGALAFFAISWLTTDLNDWRELLNQRLHITGRTPVFELLHEWGLLLLMLAFAFVVRGTYLKWRTRKKI